MPPIKLAIDAACKRHKITVTEIALRAGVSRETLYRIMRGDGNRAKVVTVCAIARAARMAPIVLLRLTHNDLDNGALTLLPLEEDGDHALFISDITLPRWLHGARRTALQEDLDAAKHGCGAVGEAET